MSDHLPVSSVDIYGQRYPIRSDLPPEYVAELARFVDEKMQAAGGATPASDSLRLAILVALNIADELFRSREATRARDGERSSRGSSSATSHVAPRPTRST